MVKCKWTKKGGIEGRIATQSSMFSQKLFIMWVNFHYMFFLPWATVTPLLWLSPWGSLAACWWCDVRETASNNRTPLGGSTLVWRQWNPCVQPQIPCVFLYTSKRHEEYWAHPILFCSPAIPPAPRGQCLLKSCTTLGEVLQFCFVVFFFAGGKCLTCALSFYQLSVNPQTIISQLLFSIYIAVPFYPLKFGASLC